MRKLLFVVLLFFIFTSLAFGGSLGEIIKNHPDAVQMGPNWWRITIKENISDTAFDWRFDRRRIEVQRGTIGIGHRLEQNSGSMPNSNWVVEYLFIDNFGDGNLNWFDVQRYITIEQDESWFKVFPRWPDEFRYPYPTEKEQSELYKEELEYWENKLQ
jgi:hypothetical protein